MSDEGLARCKALPADPALAADVYVCSYPKSGTTWMQHIVSSLLGQATQDGEHISDHTPFFEIDAHWDAAQPEPTLAPKLRENFARHGRRMFNTHLRWEMMPQHIPDAKFVYVVRDGRDTVVSFFHHLSSQLKGDGETPVFAGTFAEFHAEWAAGALPFGSWAAHLWSFAPGANEGRVLVVAYEDLVRDLPTQLRRLASFLEVERSEEELAALAPTLSFAFMRGHKERFEPISVAWKPGFRFLRKGQATGGSPAEYGEPEHRAYNALARALPPYAAEYVVSEGIPVVAG